MTLTDWENRHVISTKEPEMAKRKLKILLNIGTADQKKYGIPPGEDGETPPQAGEVISVDENIANILVNVLHAAKEFDAKEEKSMAAEAREEAAEAVLPEVQARLAREQAEKDAAKIAKGK
jgi:hypothetical protein